MINLKLKYAGLLILIILFLMGCSGYYANIRNLSGSESKAIQQELNDDWSDYDISYNSVVIVFNPKNDDKKILVANYWSTVKNQENWSQLINGTNKLPNGQINLVWGEPIREIWVDNQFYGYVSHRERELVSAQIIDENAVQLIHTYSGDWRN
jgi:hypothetical protein